ncbi:MAG: Wzz/FepE/Etk N-terminal domain-containing protein, partial [Ktedonobacteraceae bacterium]
MTVERFWAILVKQWILIVTCFIVVGLGAYIASKFMVPQYASTAIVQVDIRSGSNQADYTSLLASDQLVQTEAQLAVGDPVLREVASHYAGLTVAELEGEASSTPKLNTQLFDITVIDPNPTRAANIANDIARTLINQQVQQTQQESSLSQQQMQQDLANTQNQINDTTGKIAGLQNKPGNQGQLVVLQAQLSGLQQHYTQLQTVLAQLELSNAQSGNVLRIAQIAQPVLKPVKPSVLLNTCAGLLSGLLLGVLLAVLFEQLNTRVRNPEELSELLDWTVLATIWRTRTTTASKQSMINPQGHDANVEAYRILRTNVGFSGIDAPLR